MSVFVFLVMPPDAPVERPDDEVDAKYIAQRVGLSERTILDGKGGINEIPRVRRRPARWRRADVDRWLQKRAERAHARHKPKISLVRRKQA